MSKTVVNVKQGLQGILSLGVNTDWDEVDADLFQKTIIEDPVGAGRRFTLFLKNGGKVSVGNPKVITINRNRFHPAKFIGKDWSIFNKETDTRSTALTEIDITKVQFVTMLHDGETHIKGEEKVKRLKSSGHIRLDADIFLTLWENQHFIPESWKEKVNGNTRFIYFDGIILRNSGGDRCVLCLYWDDGKWYWYVNWLVSDWSAHGPSVVLAS